MGGRVQAKNMTFLADVMGALDALVTKKLVNNFFKPDKNIVCFIVCPT